MARLILNCDLGEDESLAQTDQLLSLVDAASIGCGYHAGSAEKTKATIELALKHGVMIGAHPGLLTGGGRGTTVPSARDFLNLLEIQIGAFRHLAKPLKATIHYIKLHGTLYHAVEAQAELAEVYIQFIKQQSPELALFALSDGRLAKAAEASGLRVYHEAFADRAYRKDATLLPRSHEEAVLTEKDALKRFLTWIEQGAMLTNCGHSIPMKADTLCVHGDSPDALAMIQKIRQLNLRGGAGADLICDE